MIVLWIMLWTIVGGFILTGVIHTGQAIHSRKVYGLPRGETINMSWAGKQLIREYNALPDNFRPHANIQNIVKALDTKHGTASHFGTTIRGSEGPYFKASWYCACGTYNNCSHAPYWQLHNSFAEIQAKYNEQQHALELAGVQSGLDGAEDLLARLKENKEILDDVTNNTIKALS